MKHDLLQAFLDRPTARRFDALVEGTRTRLVAAAWRVLGDLDTAEDVVQEVYVETLEDRGGGRTIRNGIGWLVQTTIFRARTRLRSLARLRARDAQVVAGAAESTSVGEEAARHAEVRDAVAALADDLRGPVELRYFGGLSTREIASALDVTPRAVDKRLKRARDELAPRLAPAALGGLRAALLEPALVPEWIATAAAQLQGPAIRAAAGVTLPTATGASMAAIGAALVLVLALGVGGFALFRPATPAPKPGPEVPPRETARLDAAEPVPNAHLQGSTPIEDAPADGVSTPEEASGVAAAPDEALTIRIVGPDGALVRRGRMKFGAHSSEDEIRLRGMVQQDPELLAWSWLLSYFPLADHNPIELPTVPAAFRDFVFAVHLDVPGLYGPLEIEIAAGALRVIQLEPTVKRRVVVRDAVTRLAVADAHLEATRQGPGWPDIVPHGRSFEEPPRTHVDASGTASLAGLSPAWTHVKATAPGYLPAHLLLDDATDDLRVDLVPIGACATLDVQVFREPDVPLVGATVVLAHDRKIQQTTGADGHARFENLAPGEAWISLSGESVALFRNHQLAGFHVPDRTGPDEPTMARVDLEAGTTTHARLGFMAPGTGVVIARVSKPTGEGLGGQQVRLDGPVTRLGRTDETGRVVFPDLPAGRYDAHVWKIGTTPSDTPEVTQQSNENVRVEADATREVAFVFGERVVRIQLQGSEDDASPSPGWATLRGPDGRWQGPTCYEEETVVFLHVAPGPWEVRAGTLETAEVRKAIEVPVDTDPPPVPLRLVRGGRVSLRFLVPANRAALLEVRARLEGTGGQAHDLALDPAGGLVWTSKPVLPGAWTLVVERPGEPPLRRPVEVQDGHTSRVDL